MVVDMRHPLTRDGRPALADVDAGEFEAPKKRRGVDAVERRVVGEFGRGEAIVIDENLVEAPFLDQIDREMPAVVSGHEMRRPLARSGGFIYNPTMSRTFGANSGSALNLKDSTRCGCSLCFLRIRCTVAGLTF